jgi:ABC-type lipoprotein export system ATPase subunit
LTVAEWIHSCESDNLSPQSNEQDVLLVHGVFGSGKSHLLTILIMFLCALFEEGQNKEGRILVSAATNVAGIISYV